MQTGEGRSTTAEREWSLTQPLQVERIPDGERFLIVVEIDVDALQFLPPLPDLLRPVLESRARVAALVAAARAMQADVGEVRGDRERRLKAGEVVDAECGVVGTEYFKDCLGMPGWVAQLARIPAPFR